MAIVYVINFTCPTTPAFALRPSEENGPGSGGVVSTSLSLFGMGAQRWGEGVDENMLHLLENFAANPIGPPRDGLLNITLAGAPFPDVYTPGATWKDLLDFPIVGQMWYNKVIEGMMLYNGTNWVKMRGANVFPTPDPVHGDLWLDEDFHTPGHPSLATIAQLMFWDGTGWRSAAEPYVKRAGDTMFGDLQMIDNTQTIYGDIGSEHLVINEGNGDVDVCPDIHKLVGDLLVASVDTVHILFDSNDDGVGEFQVRIGNAGDPSKNLLTSDWCFRVEQDCTLSVNPNLDYENLVTDDDDIPNNKKLFDDIAALATVYWALDGTNAPNAPMSLGNQSLCNVGAAINGSCVVSRDEGDGRWVEIPGDQMTGTLDFAVDGTVTPSICNTAQLTIAANGGVLIAVDKDNNSSGAADPFLVGMNGDSTTTATILMTVQQDGRILANTVGYTALVTSGPVLTNKDYVDTAINTAFEIRTGNAPGTTGAQSGAERNILVWDKDVFWTGTQLLITRGPNSTTTEIVFPAQYTP